MSDRGHTEGCARFAHDVMVYEFYTGRPGQRYAPSHLVIDGKEYDFEWETNTDTPRCDRRAYRRLVVCPLWPGHDGPHLPCSQQLDDQLGRLVITGLRTRQ